MKVKVGDYRKGLHPLIFLLADLIFFSPLSAHACFKEWDNTEGHNLRPLDFTLRKGKLIGMVCVKGLLRSYPKGEQSGKPRGCPL